MMKVATPTTIADIKITVMISPNLFYYTSVIIEVKVKIDIYCDICKLQIGIYDIWCMMYNIRAIEQKVIYFIRNN